MTGLYGLAALAMLILVGIGAVRTAWGPTAHDRILSVQLVSTGGVAILLLLAPAGPTAVLLDLALVLALVAAVIGVAFVSGTGPPGPGADE